MYSSSICSSMIVSGFYHYLTTSPRSFLACRRIALPPILRPPGRFFASVSRCRRPARLLAHPQPVPRRPRRIGFPLPRHRHSLCHRRRRRNPRSGPRYGLHRFGIQLRQRRLHIVEPVAPRDFSFGRPAAHYVHILSATWPAWVNASGPRVILQTIPSDGYVRCYHDVCILGLP